MKKQLFWSVALSVLSAVSSKSILLGGLTLRDTKDSFPIFTDGSVADDIVVAEDNSVSWVATASNGAGGGVSFYFKQNHEEINIANYESMDIELDYSPVEGKWNPDAMNPGICIRILPWDSTGLFGGYEDLECFDTEEYSGTVKRNIKIPSDFAEKIITTSEFDSVLGFAVKYNDYERGNTDGDQLKIVLKNVQLNAKEGAPEDVPLNDGLTDDQRGTVKEIYYPTRDYTVAEADLTDADRYEKHAWVYLPAGYDPEDKDTEYPLFILLHGFGQNENTWGLTNKGRGGKIKGYMDRGMASGNVKKFILVAITEIASKNWGPNGLGTDVAGAGAFVGELRNDLLPYLKANFNVKDGRDNLAMAGLSMGAAITYRVGIQQCLDLISNFAVFSGTIGSEEVLKQYMTSIDENENYKGLKIHNFYMNCGTADTLMWDTYPPHVTAMKAWDRIENFEDYTFPGGTHDFPVWYKGFNDFIQMVFQPPKEQQPEEPKVEKKCTRITVKRCRARKTL